MDPPDVVREVVRRFQTGKPVSDFFAAGYRVVGTPAPAMPTPLEDGADVRVATMRSEGLEAHVREITPGVDGRVLVQSVWVHHGTTRGGSAFLVHAVMTVRDGLLTETHYFPTRGEAERYAGIPERD